MKNKIVFASGIAVGYVFGTRAGRDSYEKLKTKANELWNNPKVQETVSDTTETLKSKAPGLQEKASEAADKAKSSAGSAMHRGGGSDGSGGSGGSSGGDEGIGSDGTGPAGGNPSEVEEQPFQNQDPSTRPTTH